VTRVFIVAASPLARAGLDHLLTARGVGVAGTATSVESLGEQLADAAADVVLLDCGGEAAGTIVDSMADSGLAADSCVVLLTDVWSPAATAQALRAGVRAVLPSDIPPDQLVAALEAAARGLLVFHPTSAPASLRPGETGALSRAASSANGFDTLVEPLTPRESEVLQMLAAGLGNKEIAVKLCISDHTVKFHVASILGKLGVASRTEAVSLGIRRGLVLL